MVMVPKGRAMTPKGQMSSSGSGPAIMMMPPHIRATFMPNPPLRPLPPPLNRRPKDAWYASRDRDKNRGDKDNDGAKDMEEGEDDAAAVVVTDDEDRRKIKKEKIKKEASKAGAGQGRAVAGISGVGYLMAQFERMPAPKPKPATTSRTHKTARRASRDKKRSAELRPLVEEFLREKKDSRGEYGGMNCYKTLFVGRLAYEVTERKLLREFETYGPIKDLKLVHVRKSKSGGTGDDDDRPDRDMVVEAPDVDAAGVALKKSRGYAFVEFEREEDMKAAYRRADGMRLDGRAIVVDVERGHTVPTFVPRRLGGGLGATRASRKPGGPGNPAARAPGRYDPDAASRRGMGTGMGPGPGGPGGGGGPPPMGHGGPPMGGMGGHGGPPPGYRDGPPPPRWGGGGGGGGPPRGGGQGIGYRDGPGGPPPPRDRYGGGGGPPPGYGGGAPPGGGGSRYGPPPTGRYGRDDRDYGGGRDGGRRDRDRDRGDRDRDRDRGGRYGGGGSSSGKRPRSRSPSPRGGGRRRY